MLLEQFSGAITRCSSSSTSEAALYLRLEASRMFVFEPYRPPKPVLSPCWLESVIVSNGVFHCSPSMSVLMQLPSV